MLVGQKNLNADPATGPGEVINVAQVLRFPGYSPRTLQRRCRPVEARAPVGAPCRSLIARNQPPKGTRSYIAGWGDTKPYDSPSSAFPRTFTRPSSRPSATASAASSPVHAGSYDGRTMFCAGTPRARPDTCQGDSGGPIAIRKAGAQPWRLIGVTSYGFCGRKPPWLAVYTRITANPIEGWINRILP